MSRLRVGVLAVQGDFALHQKVLQNLKIDYLSVKTPEDLLKADALIIPGGESTTLMKLFDAVHLQDPIKEFGQQKAIMGTCAGLIVLARRVNRQTIDTLGLIDIDVERNAYGRQVDSFIDRIEINMDQEKSDFEGVFIRAPKITRTGEGVIPLGQYRDTVVMAENQNILVATFHPELTEDNRIHQYFIKKAKKI